MNIEVVQIMQEDALENTQRKLALSENEVATLKKTLAEKTDMAVDLKTANVILRTKLQYLESQYEIVLDKLLGKI